MTKLSMAFNIVDSESSVSAQFFPQVLSSVLSTFEPHVKLFELIGSMNNSQNPFVNWIISR